MYAELADETSAIIPPLPSVRVSIHRKNAKKTERKQNLSWKSNVTIILTDNCKFILGSILK